MEGSLPLKGGLIEEGNRRSPASRIRKTCLRNNGPARHQHGRPPHRCILQGTGRAIFGSLTASFGSFPAPPTIEPCIDLLNTPELIKMVLPFVVADVWVGTLNHSKPQKKAVTVLSMNVGKPEVLKALGVIVENQKPSPKTLRILKEIQALSPKVMFKQGEKLTHADFRAQLGLPKGIFGVGEWGKNKEKPKKYNQFRGCPHDCSYCWAKMDMFQKKLIKSLGEWTTVVRKATQPSGAK